MKSGDPGGVDRSCATRRDKLASNRERSAARFRELWKDPKFRERHAARCSRAMKELWKDPKFRERHSERIGKMMRALWKDPKFRERQATRRAAKYSELEFQREPARQLALVGVALRAATEKYTTRKALAAYIERLADELSRPST